MALTAAQLVTLRANIDADGTLNTLPHTAQIIQTIVDAYNVLAVPDFWVWRTAVTREEYLFAAGPDGTVFDYAGTGYVGRTLQELQLFESLFSTRGGMANPSLPQVRAAVGVALAGAVAPAPANRTHLLAVSRKRATRLEKLFATGTGTSASPAVMGAEGLLTESEAYQAWGNP